MTISYYFSSISLRTVSFIVDVWIHLRYGFVMVGKDLCIWKFRNIRFVLLLLLDYMFQRHGRQLENRAMPATLLKIQSLLGTSQSLVCYVAGLNSLVNLAGKFKAGKVFERECYSEHYQVPSIIC